MSPKIIESRTTKLFSAKDFEPQEGYSSDLRRDLYGKLWIASSTGDPYNPYTYYVGGIGLYCYNYTNNIIVVAIRSIKFLGDLFVGFRFFYNEINLVTGNSVRRTQSNVMESVPYSTSPLPSYRKTTNMNFLLLGNRILKVVLGIPKWYSYPQLEYISEKWVFSWCTHYCWRTESSADTNYLYRAVFSPINKISKINASTFSVVSETEKLGTPLGVAASGSHIFFVDYKECPGYTYHLCKRDHTLLKASETRVSLSYYPVYVLGAGHGRILVGGDTVSGVYDSTSLSRIKSLPANTSINGVMYSRKRIRIAQNGITNNYFTFLSTTDKEYVYGCDLFKYISVYDTSINKIKDINVIDESEFVNW